MDPLWLVFAFFFGFVVRHVGLPPLVGFLIAGFVLNAFGVQGGETLEHISELGVTLLLFSIGVKLQVRTLLRAEIWAGASIHMLLTVALLTAGLLGLAAVGLPGFAGLDLRLSLLVAFALSFSSTVFAVKVLEEKGEMASLHGRIAIGILIMQDVIAVVFLTASAGKLPSPWAIALVAALWPLRLVLLVILDRCGHGELLILFGVLLTFGGARGFEAVGLKPDLGALVFGMLVASHPKASELAKSLLSFKDLFLVAFFLSIGISGAPTLGSLAMAAVFVAVVPLKVGLYMLVLTQFGLRARTSLLASLSLANYSEFGLIVGAVAVKAGWLDAGWLVTIAIALSITFVLASPLNAASHTIYSRWRHRLRRWETGRYHAEEQPVEPGDAEIAILGMGRVGAAAFDIMRQRYGDVIFGIDFEAGTVARHERAGRKVFLGDATDLQFWERLQTDRGRIRLVVSTLPNVTENLSVAKRLAEGGYTGLIAATAHFDDQAAALKEAGVHAVFNFYSEAGVGLAEHALQQLEAANHESSGDA